MSSGLDATAEALLRLGSPGAHPAGAVVAVWSDGAVEAGAAGWAVRPTPAGEEPAGARGDGPGGVPMQPETVVDLASVTKLASTTALAVRLVADGRLDLDAAVADFLPAFASGAVTVRHLLAHTAGLPPWLPLYCRWTDRDEALAGVAGLAPLRAPGREWEYSDLGMVLAGAVVEAVTGAPQDRAFAELVADPLGLAHTGYGPVGPVGVAAGSDGDVVEHEMVRTGAPYPSAATVEDFDGWRDEPTIGVPNDGNAAHALGGVAGHAGLFGSAPELVRLGRWLVDPQVHGEAVVATFTAPLDVAPDCALGSRLAHLPLGDELVPVVLHPGFTGTVLATALDRDLAVFAAATRLHGTTGTRRRPLTPRDRLVPVDDVLRTAWSGATQALAATTNGACR